MNNELNNTEMKSTDKYLLEALKEVTSSLKHMLDGRHNLPYYLDKRFHKEIELANEAIRKAES